MKKLFMLFAASAMMSMVACSGDKSQNDSSEDTSVKSPVAETLTPAQANSKKGQDYIQNLLSTDTAVCVTSSGLAYKVITPGKGDSPRTNSNVRVSYIGKHINGEEFDNSNGEVVPFNLGGVISGFREGIALMNKGAVYEFYIPGELAYGEKGQPQGGIAPNELLIFEVELVDFD